MKLFAKSCVEGLGCEREFVFANSFPITRHTTEFVSRLYSVKLSHMNKLAKLRDAIAISNLKLSMTDLPTD